MNELTMLNSSKEEKRNPSQVTTAAVLPGMCDKVVHRDLNRLPLNDVMKRL